MQETYKLIQRFKNKCIRKNTLEVDIPLPMIYKQK